MKRFGYLLVLVTYAAVSTAGTDHVVSPSLLPDEIAMQWISEDPTVRSARSELEAARVDAAQMEASPYEWTSRLSYQDRRYERGADSHEWNVALERQVRLPAKRTADQSMASAARSAAEGQFEIARRQAAQDLLDLWLDWSAAHSATQVLAQQRQLALDSLLAVKTRVEHGDAALLEQRLIEADVNDLEGDVSAANTREDVAKAKLLARFGKDQLPPVTPIPEPASPPHDASWWQERIVAASAAMAVAHSELAGAEAAVGRAQADRLPDPTFGVYVSSEAYGDENIIGGTVSIPFPGERRTLEVQRQVANMNAIRERGIAIEMGTRGIAHSAYASARGAYEHWHLARKTLALHRDNAALVKKAYELGEQDLQTLLLARRQALSAAETENQSRADAVRAYSILLLNAGLLWGDSPAKLESR